MTPIDFTSELAPLIWTMEGLMLVAVTWLVAMFFTEQMRAGHSRLDASGATGTEPSASASSHENTSDHDRRMAA